MGEIRIDIQMDADYRPTARLAAALTELSAALDEAHPAEVAGFAKGGGEVAMEELHLALQRAPGQPFAFAFVGIAQVETAIPAVIQRNESNLF